MKLLIIGHARHGKDTVAEIISRRTGKKFISSSEFACKHLVYPKLELLYNYSDERECFLDRVNHREEWFNIISEYNFEDRSKLAKDILKINDIYVGLRSYEEFKAARNLFDMIIYVDAYPRLPRDDYTFQIPESEATVTIKNSGTFEDLIYNVERILPLID